MSLSGRVGIGNIAGVATAITFGGPGAVFWMWTVAFLGASTAYVESTLGQIYKEKDDARPLSRRARRTTSKRRWARSGTRVIFAFATVIATGLLLPGVQANGIAAGVQNAWGVSSGITAAALVLALGVIIVGGVTRIARFAEIVVPFMALGYIVMAIVIMAINAERLPGVFALILKSAFGVEAAFGAMLGLAVEWGVKRGVYSNEAGQGTGPHAAAAAEVSHPAEAGLRAGVLDLRRHAARVLRDGVHDSVDRQVQRAAHPDGSLIVNQLPGVETGPALHAGGRRLGVPGFGASFVALALMFFFAFTTIVAYYYMAETNIQYINRKLHRPWTVVALKVAIMVSVAFGAVRSAGLRGISATSASA